MAFCPEKRHSSRVRLQCPLHYRVLPLGAASLRNAVVQDVSLRGFKFWSQEFIPKNADFFVEMDLPGHAPIRSLAKAVWIRERPDDGGCEVGSMFVDPPHNARTTLSRFVAEQLQLAG